MEGLKSGTTIACFQALGKIPVAREVLIMHVMHEMMEMMTGRTSMRNRNGMPSEATAFVSLRLLMVIMTVSVSTGSGLKHAPSLSTGLWLLTVVSCGPQRECCVRSYLVLPMFEKKLVEFFSFNRRSVKSERARITFLAGD